MGGVAVERHASPVRPKRLAYCERVNGTRTWFTRGKINFSMIFQFFISKSSLIGKKVAGKTIENNLGAHFEF
jgi:hypothetical protein